MYQLGQQYSAARGFSCHAAEFAVYCLICCLLRKKGLLPIFAAFISHSSFFGLFVNLTIYKKIKSSRCKLWFCALAPLSKLDTR